MESAQKLEAELKQLIIESLMLDDVAPESIDSAAPLFGTNADGKGLGLDSIDALELAMAIDKVYGIRLRADDDANRKIFANIQALAEFVGANRAAK